MFREVANSVARWRKVRRTAEELRNLSDRDLFDIGISRHDINRVARGGNL